MSTTLSKGYKLPQSGDKGSSFFPDLEFDIQRLNDHSHNGTDSAVLVGANVTATTVSLPSGSWVVSGNKFRQLVTMPVTPTAMQFDNYYPVFKNSSTGEVIHGVGVEKVSATTFYAYINDNTVSLTCYLLS